MRIDDGRAIPNFINQMINNNDITIYGDGTQTRSFCFIDDTIEGIYQLLNYNYKLPVNIGNPDEYTINQLVSIIKSIITCKSDIIYCELPENDPKIRKPDISLAHNLLKWEPKIKLKD